MKQLRYFPLLFVAYVGMVSLLTEGKASACYSAAGSTATYQCREKKLVVENNDPDFKSELLFRF